MFRILSLVVNISAQANLAQKEKQAPPTTALTVPPYSETLWTHLRKARLTSPATLSHTSPSTSGVVHDPSSLSMYLCCYRITPEAKLRREADFFGNWTLRQLQAEHPYDNPGPKLE